MATAALGLATSYPGLLTIYAANLVFNATGAAALILSPGEFVSKQSATYHVDAQTVDIAQQAGANKLPTIGLTLLRLYYALRRDAFPTAIQAHLDVACLSALAINSATQIYFAHAYARSGRWKIGQSDGPAQAVVSLPLYGLTAINLLALVGRLWTLYR